MNYWRIVNKIIRESDIILEVLDARMVQQSRNPEIEEKVRAAGKRLIYVINKIDLVNARHLREGAQELSPVIFVSSKGKKGTTILLKTLLRWAEKDDTTVGVLGYPNTGKSSVINALKGRKSARTSPMGGFTTNIQKVRINKRIILIDTPGVLPFKEKDEVKHAIIGTKNINQIKDIESVALGFIAEKKEILEHHFMIELSDDAEEALEQLAKKLNLMLKGGLPDVIRASKRILEDWQKGKINEIDSF